MPRAGGQIEVLRAVFSEWEKGNFRASGAILSPDVVSMWFEPPHGDVVCEGPQEIAKRFGEFLRTWSDFRVEAEEFLRLDDDHVMVVARQRGRGAHSGLETDMRVYIVWEFAGDKVVGTFWFADRGKALRLAGLSAP